VLEAATRLTEKIAAVRIKNIENIIKCDDFSFVTFFLFSCARLQILKNIQNLLIFKYFYDSSLILRFLMLSLKPYFHLWMLKRIRKNGKKEIKNGKKEKKE